MDEEILDPPLSSRIVKLKSDGSNNLRQTLGRISRALKKVFHLSPYQVSGG